MLLVAYVAHPFGGDPANLDRAERWLEWAIRNYPHVAPIAPWIPSCRIEAAAEVAGDRGQLRELGMQRCFAAVRRCDQLWLVGGWISPGMTDELGVAMARQVRVVDLTCLGDEPPADRCDRANQIMGVD